MLTNPLNYLWKNKNTILLAFILAVTVWISAVYASDPIQEDGLVNDPVLEIVGLDEDFVQVYELPEVVKVQLRAPRSVWEEINDRTDVIRAQLDVTDLGAGEHEIQVTLGYDVSPIQIVDIQPSSVTIKLENFITKEETIFSMVQGEVALGFKGSPPVLSEAQVTISGPQSLVEQVDEVHAVVGVSNARESITTQVTLLPVDSNKQVVRGVTLSPDRVTATVEIVQEGRYRDVAVKVETLGQPASGYRVTNISVSPPTLTLFSENRQLIADMPGYVSTHPVDLTELDDDLEIRLALDLSEGVTIIGDEQSVQVQIGIAAFETSVSLTVPINIVGLGEGLEAVVSPEFVDIFLTGPQPVLENLTLEDVLIIVDLTDLETGSFLIEPQVEILPDRVVLGAINPDTIEVIITLANSSQQNSTPTPTPSPTPSPTP